MTGRVEETDGEISWRVSGNRLQITTFLINLFRSTQVLLRLQRFGIVSFELLMLSFGNLHDFELFHFDLLVFTLVRVPIQHPNRSCPSMRTTWPPSARESSFSSAFVSAICCEAIRLDYNLAYRLAFSTVPSRPVCKLTSRSTAGVLPTSSSPRVTAESHRAKRRTLERDSADVPSDSPSVGPFGARSERELEEELNEVLKQEFEREARLQRIVKKFGKVTRPLDHPFLEINSNV